MSVVQGSSVSNAVIYGFRMGRIYTANESPCTMPIHSPFSAQGRDRREDVKKRAKNSGEWAT